MKEIAENVYVETFYPGVNVGCIVGERGAICIDTPTLSDDARQWKEQIKSVGGDPIRYVVYTSGHCDRILGTQYLGGTVVSHDLTWRQIHDYVESNAYQAMCDTLLERDPRAANLKVMLPQITFSETLLLYIDERPVILAWAAGPALWVRLFDEGILFAGDTVVIDDHPPLADMDTYGWLKALQRLRHKRFRADLIVPGRGPLCQKQDTRFTSDYLSRARSRVRSVYRVGKPKSELNAAASEMFEFVSSSSQDKDRLQRQIKLGLDHIYEEFKAADTEASGG
jgi:glyoxylase-like metal-dependent hydrolase (beta-lactamase superfamily II)